MLLDGFSASASARGFTHASEASQADYKVIQPRFPTGNTVLHSVFLNADLSARPYPAPDFQTAIDAAIGLQDVLTLSQYEMSHVWMLTWENAATKKKLCRLGELSVKGRKCMIIDPETQKIKLRILWLPRYLENSHVVEALKLFGAVKSISREKWRCPEMEHIETLNREVVLRLADGVTVERVPHLLNVYGCQCLVLVSSRPSLSLRCTRVGYVRRYCRTPRWQKCRRFGYSSADCVTMYATKLKGAVESDNGSSRELIMDITEVIDASGEDFEDKLMEVASAPAA